jgi:nucleotidyltransferase/DNA polymerase involved in DNA repair
MLDPSLRGKPVAVGGGVVLAASYEAKAFGVRGGMPGRKACELCPQLIFVSGHFKDYQRLGDAAIRVLGDFTPLVERISIDEAFADVAGTEHLFGPPAEIAKAIRRRIRTELGLPISVGVARTKHLAKIASQVAKPDGLLVVDPLTELEFLHGLPVELMWGVGPATKARLAEFGVLTIGQLAQTSPRSLDRLLGRAASDKLSALAWNRDPRKIKTRRRAPSRRERSRRSARSPRQNASSGLRSSSRRPYRKPPPGQITAWSDCDGAGTVRRSPLGYPLPSAHGAGNPDVRQDHGHLTPADQHDRKRSFRTFAFDFVFEQRRRQAADFSVVLHDQYGWIF